MRPPQTLTEHPETQTVLELANVVREYPSTPPVRAVDDVTIKIRAGELVAIVGASGSGKSTLLNLIGTLDRPTTGTVRIQGETTTELSDAKLAAMRSAHIGFVFQQFHLLEGVTAQANVANGLLYRGTNRHQRNRMARDALARVGLEHRATHRPPQLSGGERQRVAIARAVVGDPAIVLADEPTGNLDSTTSTEIVDLFHQLHADGSTIVVITHDRDLAAELPRRITLHDGQVIADEHTNRRHLPANGPAR